MNLSALRKLVGLAFVLSVSGFVVEWIGDATSSPLMVRVGQWTCFAGMALVVGTAAWIGVRRLPRGP